MKKDISEKRKKPLPLYGSKQPCYKEFRQNLEDSINRDINKEWEKEAPDMPFRMPIKQYIQQQIPFSEYFEVDKPKLDGQFKNKYENETTIPKNTGGQKPDNGGQFGDNDYFTTFPDYI